VKVNVENGLVRHRPVVLEDVELLGPRDRPDGATEAGEDPPYGGGGVVRELVECRGFFLGDDQGVAEAQRADVEKREDEVVLVHFVAGDVPAENLAEDRVPHGAELIRSAGGRPDHVGFTGAGCRPTLGPMKTLIPFLALTMVLGCGSTNSNNTGGSGGTAGTGGTAGAGGAGGTRGTVFSADPPLTIGGERPAAVDIPRGYDPSVEHPLVVVLHGFGPYTGQIQAAFFGLLNMVDEKDLVMLLPDGTLNEDGDRFWNGASFCCDPDNAIDDVAYLTGLIEEAKQTYNIDAKRVYLVGHSNGGFMSFRMACEASESITAIASLAGSTFADPADCKPTTLPVSVLAVHGTADTTILYDGVPDGYPSAVDTVELFAAAAGCDTGSPDTLGTVNLVSMVDGNETEQVEYQTGCQGGVNSALWTIQDGVHVPFFYQPGNSEPVFADLVTDWLLEHSR
jgi:polyhydroxybutyrate depolymerase